MVLDNRFLKIKEDQDLIKKEMKSSNLENKLALSYSYFWNIGKGDYIYCDEREAVHVRSFVCEDNDSLLIILPGRGESSLKYAELALELKNDGYDILIIDHRGQGFSERNQAATDYIHIDNFDEYIEDFKIINDHFCGMKEYKSKYILAHSMGAAIALRYIQKYGENTFRGIVLSCPMLKIKSQSIPLSLGIIFLKLASLLQQGFRPIWSRDTQKNKKYFLNNPMTHCRERFLWSKKMIELFPHISSASPTLNWVKESILAGKKIMKYRNSFKCPMLLIQADQDSIVCNEAQNRFAHRVENCRIIRLKECRHEVLQESDSIRNRALVQINQFLQSLA